MELKKLHVGTVSYGSDSMEEVARILRGDMHSKSPLSTLGSSQRGRREVGDRVKDDFARCVDDNGVAGLHEARQKARDRISGESRRAKNGRDYGLGNS